MEGGLSFFFFRCGVEHKVEKGHGRRLDKEEMERHEHKYRTRR